MKLNQRYNFDEDYVIDVEPMMKTALSNKRAAEEAEKVRLAESKARYDAICIVKTKITDFIHHFLNKPNNDCRHIKYDSLETGDCWHNIPDTDLLNYLDPEEVARYIVLNLKAHASVPDEIIIGAANSIGSDLGNITYTPIYKIVKEIESITSSFIIADNISKSMKENKSHTTINNPKGDGLYVSSNSDCPNALAGMQWINSLHLNDDPVNDAVYRRHLDDTHHGTQEVN